MSKKQNLNKTQTINIDKIQVEDNVSLYRYKAMSNDESVDALADRLDERITTVNEVMEEFRLFALGLKIDLANFVTFLDPPTIHLSSYVTLSKSLAKMGYLCINDYTRKDEKMVSSFCMIALIYFQFCNEACERTFADLCSLANEAMEDPDIWCIEMLSQVPNTCMEHYIQEYRSTIGAYDDLYLPSNLETICIVFLEKCSNKDIYQTIPDSIVEDTIKYMEENNYDFFSLTEDDIQGDDIENTNEKEENTPPNIDDNN